MSGCSRINTSATRSCEAFSAALPQKPQVIVPLPAPATPEPVALAGTAVGSGAGGSVASTTGAWVAAAGTLVAVGGRTAAAPQPLSATATLKRSAKRRTPRSLAI